MVSLFNKFPKRTISILSLIMLSGLLLNGCSIVTIDTMKNKLLHEDSAPSIQASEKITYESNGKKQPFVGIAMSGGGSRASNFSAAVLFELEKLGILQHATVISSVSGSSLTAAYYGLYGDNKHRWNEKSVREAFLTNFESTWLLNWLDPRNFSRYWNTNFTRSDIMIDRLNKTLYDDKRYGDLIKNFPHIFINATSYTNGQPFVFSDEHFKEKLNSSLYDFPIANAVMASSAFPGVFQPVTVKDYAVKKAFSNDDSLDLETQEYEHLIDGGASDNLGVNMIEKVYKAYKDNYNGCLLLVIDAYPYHESSEFVRQADTRDIFDYFIDSGTVMASSDVLLTENRKLNMEKIIGYDGENIGFQSYKKNSEVTSSPSYLEKNNVKEPMSCNVWHISFQRLNAREFQRIFGDKDINRLQFLDRVRKVVNTIPTRYKLMLDATIQYDPETFLGHINEAANFFGLGKDYEAEMAQDYIFKAANMLVREDKCDERTYQCSNGKLIYQDVCEQLKGIKDIESKCLSPSNH